MTSWYSNILTKTTSQISSLRSTLLSSENDGDTEDDTHVCRVLRNYYTDKGRPLPGWLPPDPKAAVAPQPLYAQSQSQVGARYGGLTAGGQPAAAAAAAATGGLSSLWESAPQGGGQHGLRAGRGMSGRGGGGGGGGGGGLVPPGREAEVQARPRPLPSQRVGSYQNAQNAGATQNSVPAAGATATAQDRLKQRLWGAARQPSPSQAGGGQFQLPSGSGGGASYEDRFAPGGSYGPPGAGGYGGGGAPRRQGLPSGPRGYK